MKLILSSLAVVLCAASVAAEEPRAPDALPEGASTDAAGLTEPLPLIPDEVPTVAKPTRGQRPENEKETDRKGRTALEKMNSSGTVEALALKARYREVKTIALSDPQVQAELAEAARARTDFERRQAMYRHYDRLFARMEKMDAKLKPLIEARHTGAVTRMKETKIEPTHPPTGYEGPVEVSAGSRKKRS